MQNWPQIRENIYTQKNYDTYRNIIKLATFPNMIEDWID